MVEQQQTLPKRRGDGKLAWLSQRREGELIEYEHQYGVPIDKEDSNGAKIIHYVGKLAKDCENFRFDEPNWRKIVNIKEKINEAREEVKSVFKFNEESENWFRKTLNERWRTNKYNKKRKYFDPYDTEEEWFAHCPPSVEEGQWHNMVAYWQTNDFEKLSKINKENKSKQTICHKAGSKSYINHGAQIEKETGKPATRTTIYKKTHHKNPLAADNIRRMEELEMKALEDSTSFQEDGLQVEGDIYASVMEPNKRRKIRGVGLGVKASTLKRGPSRSRNSNQAEVEKLREEVSFMREEREVMLREHEKVREELRLEMQREMQKSRDEMKKNVQVMLRMIVRNTPDKEVSPTTTNQD